MGLPLQFLLYFSRRSEVRSAWRAIRTFIYGCVSKSKGTGLGGGPTPQSNRNLKASLAAFRCTASTLAVYCNPSAPRCPSGSGRKGLLLVGGGIFPSVARCAHRLPHSVGREMRTPTPSLRRSRDAHTDPSTPKSHGREMRTPCPVAFAQPVARCAHRWYPSSPSTGTQAPVARCAHRAAPLPVPAGPGPTAQRDPDLVRPSHNAATGRGTRRYRWPPSMGNWGRPL